MCSTLTELFSTNDLFISINYYPVKRLKFLRVKLCSLTIKILFGSVGAFMENCGCLPGVQVDFKWRAREV
jgi:hypothetical protein